jgi:stearoyl-CoA desaturase (delta-9 desaturase)
LLRKQVDTQQTLLPTIMPSHQMGASINQAVKPEFESAQPKGAAMANKAEPNRNPKYDPSKVHITETRMEWSNWWKHINCE